MRVGTPFFFLFEVFINQDVEHTLAFGMDHDHAVVFFRSSKSGK